jgi:hypothetical protein
MDWIVLAQDRDRWLVLENAVMNFQVPLNAGNFLTSSELFIFSRRTLLCGVSVFLLRTLVLDLFSGACLNKLLLPWCAVTENI